MATFSLLHFKTVYNAKEYCLRSWVCVLLSWTLGNLVLTYNLTTYNLTTDLYALSMNTVPLRLLTWQLTISSAILRPVPGETLLTLSEYLIRKSWKEYIKFYCVKVLWFSEEVNREEMIFLYYYLILFQWCFGCV